MEALNQSGDLPGSGDRESPQDAAKRLLESANGDTRLATEWFKDWINDERRWYELTFDYYASKYAYEVVRGVVRKERKGIWRTPNHDTRSEVEQDQARTAAGVANGVRRLMDFPLPTEGQPRLRDATGIQIREGAEAFGKQASDMAEKGLWLSRVAEYVPADQVAERYVTEDLLQQLRAETE